MKKKWWHDKVAYQIYPKSFLDTNGDGIGDLRGIISKLDYLKELGIDIIWLSPIYKSPFVDQGYDISDYYAIAQEFGTMEEFDELLAEAKKRGMYIVMDLVVNHCSDQHEWFKKALADPDGEYADYFYFVKMVEEVQGVGALLEDLKHATFEKWDAFTVAEVFNMKEDELPEFIGDDGHFSTMFDFSAHELTYGEHGWYDSKPIEFKKWRDTLFASQLKLQKAGFAANIIENHDEPRGASRYLPEHAGNEAGKKMLGTTSILLRGIPFIYQGQEIGMTNCIRNDISEYDDISTKDQYQVAIDAGCSREEALRCCYENSRDNARTPMQWTDDENAGFTDGTPWLAMNPNYRQINVREQEVRTDSVLAYYRRLVHLRKADAYRETFTYGIFEPAYQEMADVFAYYRVSGESGQRILVAANFGTDAVSLPLAYPCRQVLLSNLRAESAVETACEKANALTLESCEVAVIELG